MFRTADFTEDFGGGLGPDVGLGLTVVFVEIVDDGLLQLIDAFEGAAADALSGDLGKEALILLCHKFRCLFRVAVGAAQHGQRDSVVARAATNLRRIVAIEFGTWRSGRNGGSSGLVTFV